MALSNEELDALLADPRESLGVELKRWVDPKSDEGKAKIAKGCLALRNSGGGVFVVGFDDKTCLPDLENALVKREDDVPCRCRPGNRQRVCISDFSGRGSIRHKRQTRVPNHLSATRGENTGCGEEGLNHQRKVHHQGPCGLRSLFGIKQHGEFL